MGDQYPEKGAPQAPEEILPVAVMVAHLPAEWEIETQQRVAHIHKDGVHACRQQHGNNVIMIMQDSEENDRALRHFARQTC